tara:strand:+ start:76 stop:504 length:429 start_codon:yes stop_codon:yes gene_type:complete
MKKILIVNANYYTEISKNLISASKLQLNNSNYKISLINVPGIFEIPVVITKNIKKFDAFLALGCVIKGETPHFELICKTTFDAIMKISINFKKPVGNGIITCLNMKQARARSNLSNSRSKPNKGIEATKAVISVLKNEPKRL